MGQNNSLTMLYKHMKTVLRYFENEYPRVRNMTGKINTDCNHKQIRHCILQLPCHAIL